MTTMPKLLGSFEVIWASPPCTHYSRARTTAKSPRDLEGSDALVQRTLDIIAHFRPQCWAMENPQTGLLKDRAVVAGLPFLDVTYCKYGASYKKATRIWTNLGEHRSPRPMCSRHDPCEKVTQGRHPVSAQRRAGRPGDRMFTREELYAIPPALCEEIAAATRRALDSFSARAEVPVPVHSLAHEAGAHVIVEGDGPVSAADEVGVGE
jgi:hypothetical protein